jgi:hypothetical protein
VSLLGLRHGVARHGEDRVGVAVEVVPRRTLDDPIVGVSLHRVADGTKVLDVTTEGDRIHLGRVGEPTTIELWFERLDVEPGLYRFDVGVYEHDWSVVYDYHWQAYPLEVVGPSGFGPGRSWRVTTPARR